MVIKSHKDFFSGLMFTVVGIGFAVGARTYTVGTSARMGPGYFPLLLGVILAIIGIAITLNAFGKHHDNDERIGAIAWRPLFFIIFANLVFGVLLGGLPSIGLPPLGLALAIVALVFLATLASKETKFKETVVLAFVLVVGSYLTFVTVLSLPFQVWPTFITG
ncbi:tripartite tricarboxylate transporter TctB family protein [Rhodoferax sp.]|uniref:tripartite tricarboxylate transporter TctB family protein n=1 Tax=Rhodoferax sp. TaxID=50421 RepID=UPI002609D78A|nr:tripartite tricarboxylate transporter TctB family protein [Rhodoferax sp.]MDD2924327.1 tripartite tricarboxylate transporter TctB family protein [Rhodoferax sp.]